MQEQMHKRFLYIIVTKYAIIALKMHCLSSKQFSGADSVFYEEPEELSFWLTIGLPQPTMYRMNRPSANQLPISLGRGEGVGAPNIAPSIISLLEVSVL
jgi:hypothetical protein